MGPDIEFSSKLPYKIVISIPKELNNIIIKDVRNV